MSINTDNNRWTLYFTIATSVLAVAVITLGFFTFLTNRSIDSHKTKVADNSLVISDHNESFIKINEDLRKIQIQNDNILEYIDENYDAIPYREEDMSQINETLRRHDEQIELIRNTISELH